MTKNYTERWQYLPWIGTHKKNPKGVKENPKDLSTKKMMCRSCYNSKFAVGVISVNIYQFVEAIRAGHSFKRIGPSSNGTRFLVIDIDNDFDEKIIPEELDRFCDNRTIFWTPGGSGRQYRYHIIVLLDSPIYDKYDFEAATRAVLASLAKQIGRDICPDTSQYNYLQWVFGVPQASMKRIELPETECWCLQIRDNHNYSIDEVDPYSVSHKTHSKKRGESPAPNKAKLMPYTTAQLTNWVYDNQLRAIKLSDGRYANAMACLTGKRFDCKEPGVSYRHGIDINRVAKGNRFKIARAWIFRLVPQYYRCKHLGLDFTEEDLVYTFATLCKRNFADAQEWWNETGESLSDGLLAELHSNDNLDYDQIMKKYKSSHTREFYKRRGYSLAATTYVIANYALARTATSAVFASRKALDTYLDPVCISYQTFMSHCKDMGIKVSYRDDARQSSKYDYIDSFAHYMEGINYYLTPNNAEKMYCKHSTPKIAYKSYYSIYSGNRRQYDNLVALVNDLIKGMHDFFSNHSSGVSNSVAGTEEDDSYCPDWLDDLPEYIHFPKKGVNTF